MLSTSSAVGSSEHHRANSSAKQHVVRIWQVEENGPRHAGQENIPLGVQT